MSDEPGRVVPSLKVKKPGLGVRALGLVSPGVRKVSAQIPSYTRWWDDQNQLAAQQVGPLWIIVGDSTSIGIGATDPTNGYVGLVVNGLRHEDSSWRVINLAMSGARVDDGLERQLPALARLPPPDVVTMCLGSNDVFWDRAPDLRDKLRQMVAGLPAGSYVANVAGVSERAKLANRALRAAAEEYGHTTVDPWNQPGPGERLASDRFHPNDLGYQYMARPFAQAMGVACPPIGQN